MKSTFLQKKMRCVVGWLGVAVVAVLAPVSAAEIAFTGGSDGTCTDLSVAANWAGGVLPGAGDTGVVDYSTFSGDGALTVGSDLALGGLSFRNATAALTLSGAGTLSLGAAGLGVKNATALSLKLPIVVTAASTWPFNKGALNLHSTISGTAKLGISEAGACCVYAALGYDGDLTINSQGLRFYAVGKMAKTLKATGASGDNASSYVSPSVGGEIRWSDVLTGGKFEYTNWRRLYVATTNGATDCAHIVMDDPQDEFYQNGPYRSGIASGIFEQRDGYVHSQGPQYGISVGSQHVGADQALNNGRFPVEYWLSGGSNDVAYVFIGENAKFFTNNPVLKQSGGLSKVHKGVYIGAATDSSDIGFGEYQLSGGQLYVSDGTVANDKGSDHQTRGIVLCHPFGGVGSCPGVFTQTGGTNTPLNVRFGPDTSEWNVAPKAVTDGFGIFDLKGGVVNFASATTPFAFGKGWNQGRTNSAYRVNVSGGTMNFKDGQTISAQIEMPPSDTASKWAVGSGTTTVDAPVSGYGTLKKTGAGNLILNNMNRFGGTLKVAEGMVKMAAEPEDDSAFDDASDTCWIWTADSFNATHTNGQDVASWADERHGVTAVDWTQAGTTFYAEWQKSPTFSQSGKDGLIKGYPKHLPVLVRNDDFNGHSAVRFQETILQVPAAENPLAGATNFTVALVYRQNAGGGDDPWYSRPIFGGTEYEWGGMDTMVVSMDASNRMRLNTVYRKDGKTRTIESVASRSGNNLKSKTCVVVCTFNGNDYSMNVNGYFTNAVLTSSTVRPLFKTPDRSLPLNFGGHFPDSANFSCSDTSFAEVRVYRDQALTTPQVTLLTRKLMKKYVGTAGEVEFTNELNTGLPGCLGGEAKVAAPKATDYEWTADAANALADGARVTSLDAVGGGKAATIDQAESETGPTLVKNAYNGHSALRFSSADKTALGIAASDIPVAARDFAIAVVFATKTDAPVDETAVSLNRNSGTGIVVQNLANAGGHLGFTWHREGTLLAGYNGSWNVNRRPFRLNDGMPHVAVFTRDAAGNYVYMVDGRTYSGTTTDVGANGGTRMLLGKLANGQDTGYFDGDILAVRLYGLKLTVEEAKAISEHYAQTYGFRLLPYLKTKENAANNGFGRVALEVDAAGALVLPYSQTNPFTISDGRSLKGTGKVLGSVRYAAGGVLDLTEDLPWIEDLQFADGMVLKTGSGGSLPKDASDVRSVSGTISIDVSGLPAEGPARTPVLTGLLERVVAAGTTFAVIGTTGQGAEVVLKDGVLTVVRHKGTLLILR